MLAKIQLRNHQSFANMRSAEDVAVQEVARIVRPGRTRRHLTLSPDRASSPRAREKKMRVYITRTVVAAVFCHRTEINGMRFFRVPTKRAEHTSPFSERILHFDAWHGHRRIRCQSPRESRERESLVCAPLVFTHARTHVRMYARMHATHARTHARTVDPPRRRNL